MQATGFMDKLRAIVIGRDDAETVMNHRAENCCPCECMKPRTGLRDPGARPRIHLR